MSKSLMQEALLEVGGCLYGDEPFGLADPLCPKSVPPQRALAAWRILQQVFGWKAKPKQMGHPIDKIAAHMVDKLGLVVPDRDTLRAALADLGDHHRAMVSTEPIPVRDPLVPAVLSSAQSRLWFIYKLDGPDPTFNIVSFHLLDGLPMVSLLEQAYLTIVARHESLRTTFYDEGGQALQKIHRSDLSQACLVDLSGFPEERVRAIAAEEAHYHFDLARGPLIRVTLYRMSPTRHLLACSMHHIISDGWSLGIFTRELISLYQAGCQGENMAGHLPPLPLHYSDYAVWQQDAQRQQLIEAQLDWWAKHLDGLPELLSLPTDHPRPAVMDHQGGDLPVRIEGRLYDALVRFNSEVGSSPFMTLLAAFAVILARYSGQRDLAIGTPVAGREHHDLEGLIGFFINNLVLRLQPDFRLSFRDLVARTRSSTTDAYDHAAAPFEQLVTRCGRAGAMSYTPLFQVTFAFHNTPQKALRLPGLIFEAISLGEDPAQHDLTLNLSEMKRSIIGHLNFATALFERATIAGLVDHFFNFLDKALAHPDTPLFLLDQGDSPRSILDAEPVPNVLFPHHFHEHVAEQAQRNPEAIALVRPGEEPLHYGELVRRARALAVRLRRAGVRSGDGVAVFLPDQQRQFTAMLAVLQAGAFFVPMDPAYADERLRFCVEDANPAAIIADGPLPVSWGEQNRVPFDKAPIEGDFSFPRLPAEAPIYVLYTSGSTGRPKGVQVHHAGFSNALVHMRGFYPSDWGRITSSYIFPFDGCAVFWACLAFGFELVIMPPELRPDPAAIARFAVEHECHFLNGPTATIPLAARHMAHMGKPPLAINYGGQAITEDDWQHLVAMEGTQAFNCYGPTEITVQCSAALAQGERPHIGVNLFGYHLYVTDEMGVVLPVGMPGQLMVGGIGVSHGYRGRPAMTAERFLPNPYSSLPGSRRYATGDLVRLLPDGNLAYLGRIDQQVKIRGFRIEPAEVADTLMRHASVVSAIVVVRGKGNTARLDAYLTADEGYEPEQLRLWLEQHLPDYMVPGTLTRLERLPLTPNGKIDTRALPEPEITRQEDEAPVGATESRLAEIFAETLTLERVGRHGNFFQLGGHSLSAARTVAAINAAFEIEIPVSKIFSAPTPSALGLVIDQLRKGSGLPALVPRDRASDPPALSFAQRRLWALYKLSGPTPTYNIPLALDLRGPLDIAALHGALCDVVDRHEILRTTILDGQEPVQRIRATRLPLALIDLSGSGASDSDIAGLLDREAHFGFHLDGETVIRVQLIRLGSLRHILHLNVHHIAYDGVSTRVLIEDTAAFYRRRQGEAVSLDPLPIQYADYAAWQNGWMQGDLLAERLAFWRKELAGAPALLDLPADHPRPGVMSFRGGQYLFSLSPELSRALAGLAERHDATMFMILLGAYKLLLGRYCHSGDIPVGTPVAGRNHPLMERMIGFFVNMLVIRAPFSLDMRADDFFALVRRHTLACFDHSELPFDKLVELLNPERDLSHTPLYQVAFSWMEFGIAQASLPGIELASINLTTDAVKEDMMLAFSPMESGIQGTLTYNTDLFEERTIAQLATRLERLLVQLPQIEHLSEIRWTSEEERQQLLAELTSSEQETVDAQPFHERVAAQARARGAAIALRQGELVISYAALEQQSLVLAARLQAAGVLSGQGVAIYLPDQARQFVAMLAVLKCGAYFIPLDPAYSGERLSYCLEDAAPAAIIADEVPGQTIALQVPYVVTGDADGLRPCQPPGPIYAIYTSGSTGRPKGVLVHHEGFDNALVHMQAFYDAPESPAPITSSYIFPFDGCALFWSCLAFGFELVILPPELRPDALAIARFAIEHGCRFLSGPTAIIPLAAWHMQRLGAPPAVVTYGGQAISEEDWQHLGEMHATRSYNCYGPTEATVQCSAGEASVQLAPHIGKRLHGYDLYVTDAALELQPQGIPGQLMVGGPGVAYGYWGQPAMTAARFLPNPFANSPGARWYATGDLVRLLPAGVLVYQGRIDQQVKVRGFRVEPGEIAGVMMRYPGVDNAVVVANGKGNAARLDGYLVAATTLDVDRVRSWLAEQLPDYMVPSSLTVLEGLPLTPNGKVDLRALPVPQFEEREDDPPVGPLETRLAALFADTLGLEGIGRHGNFFQLGGHSLSAARVMAAINVAFEIEVPVSKIFSAPTPAALAPIIDEAQGGKSLPPLTPRDREDDPPALSYAQRRLWVLYKVSGPSPTYNLPFALRLSGALAIDPLHRAILGVMARHEILRTTVLDISPEPLQLIAEVPELELPVIDLGGLDTAHAEATAAHLFRLATAHGFRLDGGGVMRALLLRFDVHSHALHFNVHHIAFDGVSNNILIDDLGFSYEHALFGGTEQPPLPIQYADYSVWQNHWMRGDLLGQQLAFWRDALAGAPPLLDLPTDYPRPKQLSTNGANLPVRIPCQVGDGLRRLVERHDVTLFMVLIGAWQLVLGRWAGKLDVPVGTPHAGRNHPLLEGLIGFFINTLVIRAPHRRDASVAEFFAIVRERTLAAFDHADLPFDKLVEALNPERDLNYAPIAQVTFTWQNFEAAPEDILRGIRVDPLDAHVATVKLDLALILGDSPEGIVGGLAYSTDLFDEETARRLMDRYVLLLEQLPQVAYLSELAWMREDERHELLAALVQPVRNRIPARSFVDLVADQAAARPDAPALCFPDGEVITYAALMAEAEMMSAHLRACGVRPGDGVAILTPEQDRQFVALLAASRAGAFAVPLDPDAPDSRTDYILADTQPAAIVTDQFLFDLPEGCVLVPDTADEPPEQEPPAASVPVESAIYAIYTSGSTGRPKGVLVPHSAVCNLVFAAWNASFRRLEPPLRVTSSMAFTFDGGVAFWGCLALGYELCLMPVALRPDPPGIAAFTAEYDCRILICPTATGPQAGRELHRLGHVLDALMFGGEAIREDDWIFLAQLAETHVSNIYGPTETTVYATVGWPSLETSPHVGRTIPGYRAYLADRDGRLQARGMPGQILIGGAGLAIGYLGKPAMTAERFIPDPFSDLSGERLYATGDLAFLRNDGNLGFLGRIDRQIKLRGFRIEPDEIANTLARHEAVHAAAVLVRGSGHDARLDGYLVPVSGMPDLDEVRDWLAVELPAYMVPATLTVLDQLPLTPNGKIDFRALPEPTSAIEDEVYVVPEGPVEARLAEIWAETLDVAQVGRHDDFFLLGGHSLKAVHLVSAINATLGVEIAISHLFEGPTLAELAAVVAEQQGQVAGLPALRPRPASDEEPELSYAQKRLWVLYKMAGPSPTYNIPFAMELCGPLDVAALHNALLCVMARHDILRTTIRESLEAVQHIAAEALLDLPLVDFGGCEDVAPILPDLLARASAHCFYLDGDAVMRVVLLRLAPLRHVLHLNVHHIAFDGASMNVMIADTAAFYRACLGEACEPEPLPIQYADYAAWQNGWLQGELLARHIAFWRDALAGAPALLDLPTDHPRPAVPGFRGGSVAFELSPEVSRELSVLAERHQTTLFMVLLGAFKLLLGGYAQSGDIPVGTPIAGRNHPDLAGLVGFFVNTAVIRAPFRQSMSLAAFLASVRQHTVAAFDHAELPFDKLVEELNPERALSHSPIFQVSFSWLNFDESEASLPGLQLKPLGAGDDAVKVDLMLTMSQGPDRLSGSLSYAVDLFEPATIESMRDTFLGLLHQLPHVDALNELVWLDDAAHRRLLARFNDDVQPRVDLPFHDQVARVAAFRPDALALDAVGEGRFTYAELHEAAGHLASRLVKVGVRPGDGVALVLSKQSEQYIGMLAVLCCGAWFVPLDPDQGSDRLNATLEDAEPRVTLVDSEAPVDWGGMLLPFDISPCAAVALPRVPLDAIVYCIYTSGSTGKPKGVLVRHYSLAQVIELFRGIYGEPSGTRVSGFLNYTFDGAVVFWSNLALGHQLVVAPAPLRGDPDAAARFCFDAGTRIINAPTAIAARIALKMAELGAAPDFLIFGGEAISEEDWDRLAALPTRCFNSYGPTETTVLCTQALLRRGVRPHIGSGVPGYRIYVTGPDLRPLPAGMPGQLLVGGEGVSLGYLGRPPQTAERYLPDPFADRPGSRLYQTGDLVRLNADGDLVYLGRTDLQMKLRGFRIEPGEIEHALRRADGVVEACVFTVGTAGSARLIAALAPDDLVLEPIRARLQRELPAYMLPADYLLLEQLPLTTHGKVDHKALRLRYEAVAAEVRHRGFRAPDTPMARALADIWCEVLGLEQVGLDDNFFQLGGHSLQATRVIARIADRLGVTVPMRALFEAPTIGELVRFVSETKISEVARGADAEDVLSLSQTRLWRMFRELGPSPAYNMVDGLRLRGPLALAALERAFGALVARHETLRMFYGRKEDRDFPVVLPPASFALTVIDVGTDRVSAQALLDREARYGFLLDREPLFHAQAVRLDDEDHLLILNTHHSVSDGWSQQILRREIVALYGAALAGVPLDQVLAPLQLSFREHARRERHLLDEAEAQAHLDWWRDYLKDLPSTLALPRDVADGSLPTHLAGAAALHLDRGLTAQIDQLARQFNASRYMVLLAAVAGSLHLLTGQTDIPIGSPTAGRNRADLEPLIGFFVDAVVFRTRPVAQLCFEDLVLHAREQALAAFEHQDVSLVAVIEDFQRDQRRSDYPWRALLSLLNTPAATPAFDGPLSIEPMGTTEGKALYDLVYNFTDAGDQIVGGLMFRSSMFSQQLGQSFADHFLMLLRAGLADPKLPIEDLDTNT